MGNANSSGSGFGLKLFLCLLCYAFVAFGLIVFGFYLYFSGGSTFICNIFSFVCESFVYGCDGKINSQDVVDNCGVCGGDIIRLV